MWVLKIHNDYLTDIDIQAKDFETSFSRENAKKFSNWQDLSNTALALMCIIDNGEITIEWAIIQ